MIIRTGVMILVAVFVCCSTQAQSIVLDRGESGVFLQGGYIGSRNAYSWELDLGYAISDRVDFGGGVIQTDAGWREDSKSITSLGQFANVYPVKAGERTMLLIGLHESYSKAYAESVEGLMTWGGSVSVRTAAGRRSELLSSAGYYAAEDVENAVYGVSLIQNSGRSDKFAVFVEVAFGSGANSFAAGVDYTWAWRRE